MYNNIDSLSVIEIMWNILDQELSQNMSFKRGYFPVSLTI